MVMACMSSIVVCIVMARTLARHGFVLTVLYSLEKTKRITINARREGLRRHRVGMAYLFMAWIVMAYIIMA